MSRMSEILIEIQELYTQGYTPSEISEMSGIQLYMVLDAIKAYGEAWDIELVQDVLDADPGEMDGDAESAFASIGWGVDESYVADNDYFDDF